MSRGARRLSFGVVNAGAQRAVETHDLVKVFGTGPTEVRALDGVDFVVEDGEFVAIKQQIDDQISQQFALFNSIVAIAVIVSLLGVINTLAMSVLERTREIGVLRALGSSRWQVRRTMLYESLLITLSGAVAGVLLGALIAFLWVSGLQSVVPGISFRFPASTAALVGVLAVILGTAAAVVPARRAARLKPIEALSYE